MTKDLEKKLIEKYSSFFEYLKNDDNKEIYFSFDCDDGWYLLLDNLMGTIYDYIKCNSNKNRIKNKYIRYFYDVILYKLWTKLPYKYSKHVGNIRDKIYNYVKIENYESIPRVHITQIKEKYGMLSFNYNGGNDMIDGMVWISENISGEICEICGSTKNVYKTKGWVKTTCEECTPK